MFLQNQNVFKHVGESQLMSVISSMLGQWSQSVQQSGEAHNKIDRAKAQVAFNDFVDQVRHQGSPYPHYFDSHVLMSTMIMATGLVGFVEKDPTELMTLKVVIVLWSKGLMSPQS